MIQSDPLQPQMSGELNKRLDDKLMIFQYQGLQEVAFSRCHISVFYILQIRGKNKDRSTSPEGQTVPAENAFMKNSAYTELNFTNTESPHMNPVDTESQYSEPVYTEPQNTYITQ